MSRNLYSSDMCRFCDCKGENGTLRCVLRLESVSLIARDGRLQRLHVAAFPRPQPGWQAATRGNAMQTRLVLIVTLAITMMSTSGCVPIVIGAGGAIAADTIAEDRGRDLF